MLTFDVRFFFLRFTSFDVWVFTCFKVVLTNAWSLDVGYLLFRYLKLLVDV